MVEVSCATLHSIRLDEVRRNKDGVVGALDRCHRRIRAAQLILFLYHS
jgi:hypothetical protein